MNESVELIVTKLEALLSHLNLTGQQGFKYLVVREFVSGFGFALWSVVFLSIAYKAYRFVSCAIRQQWEDSPGPFAAACLCVLSFAAGMASVMRAIQSLFAAEGRVIMDLLDRLP